METQYEADKKLSLHRSFEMFRTKANRKRALISMLLMVGDQFLGVYVLANYGVLIYAELGLKGNLPLLLNACWTTFTIFGNTFTALTVSLSQLECMDFIDRLLGRQVRATHLPSNRIHRLYSELGLRVCS